MKTLILSVSMAFVISGCTTMTSPRYSISADTVEAIKNSLTNQVSVGSFSGSYEYDPMCRGVGNIQPPDGMTFEAYIRKAMVDELKIAGAYAEKSDVVLSGEVRKVAFSSTKSITGGAWEFAVEMKSSNGKSLSINDIYEFTSGFEGMSACRQTAEALLPAVQNLINKAVTSPEFKAMSK